MQHPSYEGVVDHLVSALAESRQSRIQRHAAYLALARAILDDERAEHRELAHSEHARA